MLGFADHALALTLAAGLPVRAILVFRGLQSAPPEAVPALRRRLHLGALVSQWALAAITLTLWWSAGRSIRELGLWPAATPGLLGVALGGAVMVPLAWHQTRRALADPESRRRLRAQVAPLERLLPHTRGEMPLFHALSVTAGICEELLFRGYLIWYLAHFVAIWPAMIVAGLVFGSGHAYQGSIGVVKTAFVGLFLGAVYLVSGSLFAPMALHALIDAQAGWVSVRLFGAADPTD